MLPLNKTPFWGTKPIKDLNLFSDKSLISTPSIVILPLLTSKYLKSKCRTVDLPEPVAPIIAVVLLGSKVKLTSSNTSSSLSGKLNVTLLNLTNPFTFSNLSSNTFSFSLIEKSVVSTSSILLAATLALGIITIDIVRKINEEIIIIEYVKNASKSPTWR